MTSHTISLLTAALLIAPWSVIAIYAGDKGVRWWRRRRRASAAGQEQAR